jgi:hypothetical protein
MRCSYYPQSLFQVRGAIREIKVWIWGSWLAGAVYPELPRLHRSDRCSWPVWPKQPLVGFFSGELLGVLAVVLCCSCFEFGSVWRSVVLFGDLGAFRLRPVWPVCCIGLTGVKPLSGSCLLSPAGTGLTGSAHRSDRCWSVDSRLGVPLRYRVGRSLCVGS